MRIDVHVSAFPVLSETFVLRQVLALIEGGHDVRVVVQSDADTTLVHEAVRRHDLLSRVVHRGDSYRLMPRDKVHRVLRAGRLFLRGDGVSRTMLLRCLNVLEHGREALTLNLFYRAYHEARDRADTDVALAHFGHNGEAVAALRRVGATRARLATVFHGYDLSRDLAGGRRVYRHLFSEGDLFLPVSEYWRRKLLTLGCEPGRVEVVHMGIDARALERVSARPPGGPARVLTVARFVEKKGLAYAVDAFARVAARFPDADYAIIGDGPLFAEIRDRIERAGLSARVRLLGALDGTAVARELERADVFLLPSVTAADGDQEGIPVVLMEAMALALPVLSTHHSGIPELVDDGETGRLVPERDVEALAEALATLLSDRALRGTMGAAGRRKVLAEFDLEVLDRTLLGLLERLHEPESKPRRARLS